MTDTRRKELFEAAIGINFIVSTIAATIQNPVEECTWEEVENRRRSLAEASKRIGAYISSVEGYLLDNTPLWAQQWDLAQELFAPYNEPYNPEDIVIEELAAKFVEGGLDLKLAEQVATQIKYPELG